MCFFTNAEAYESLEKDDYPAKAQLYCALQYYNQNTGESLTLEQVEDYLSKEFEDDGCVRIYSNGKHPEIKKYLEWLFIKSKNKENRNAFYSSQYVDYIETKRGKHTANRIHSLTGKP